MFTEKMTLKQRWKSLRVPVWILGARASNGRKRSAKTSFNSLPTIIVT